MSTVFTVMNLILSYIDYSVLTFIKKFLCLGIEFIRMIILSHRIIVFYGFCCVSYGRSIINCRQLLV